MKRLGQHFLKNGWALKKIVEALELKSGDIVIEIGAGHGELTEEIQRQATSDKRQGIKIIAIERDGGLIKILKEKFAGNKNIEIIEGDALQIIKKLPTNIIPQLWYNISNKSGGAENLAGLKIVGNIPYYITGRLFRVIGELEHKPELCVFTVQKEVAERICAGPKINPVRSRARAQARPSRASGRATSNGMNRLAASVQFWAEPKIIALLSKKDFYPAPEVESAIIKLNIKEVEPPPGGSTSQKLDAEKYYATVRKLFAQPRKTILNNISHGTYHVSREKIIEKLKKIGINPGDRPQNLSMEDIIKIAAAFRF